MKPGPSLVSLLLLLAAAPCAADVQVSLPLQGYYRPGRFMPVRVVFRGETPQQVTLSADGAVTTVVSMNASYPDVIVPLQIVRESAGPINWSLADGRKGTAETRPIRLGDADRLVGFAGGDAGAAAPLFAGRTIIPVALDVSDPLHFPVVAWETLDAAVLDRLPQQPIADWLAGTGTAVVVRSAAVPEKGVLPWRRVGEAWVIEREPAGPRGAILPDAYGPTYGWNPGRDTGERRQLLLIAIVFAILAVAATLWRSGKSLAVVVPLAALFTLAVGFRVRRQTPVTCGRGVIVVVGDGIGQYDLWRFYKSMNPAVGECAPQSTERPVFASARHFERSGIKLYCQADGQPVRYTFPLAPESAMAFLTRGPAEPPRDVRPGAAERSPLWPLVRANYLRPGLRVSGELPPPVLQPPPPQVEFWPGVVIEESAR